MKRLNTVEMAGLSYWEFSKDQNKYEVSFERNEKRKNNTPKQLKAQYT